jgi:hypothetical protein
MSYDRDTLWRLYNIGGADLALRYADIASESAKTTPPAGDLEVRSIHFYEGAEVYSGSSKPDFSVRFPKSRSRFVMYWVEFEHPWKYNTFKYKIQMRYFRPDGSMMSQTEDEIETNPQQPSFWYSSGRGWKEPGKWQPGDYRVQLMINGVEKQSVTFTIFDDQPASSSRPRGADLFSLPWQKQEAKSLGLGDLINPFIRNPSAARFDPAADDRFALPSPKLPPKSLGSDGWLKWLREQSFAAVEQPRFDPTQPLDDIGKMKALMAIDQRYRLVMFDTRPGRVCRETLGVIEAIAQDYQALMSLPPPKAPFAFWSEQSVQQKIGDTFDLAARAAVTLHDQEAATRYYNAASKAYRAAGDNVKADGCQTELSRLRAIERGDVDSEVRRLHSELARAPKNSLAAARAGIDLGMLYSNNGDDTEARELLEQAERDLMAVSSDPSGVDLANALSSSVAALLQGNGAGGPSAIEHKIEANNLYRLLYTAYARIYETTDPDKAAEYRAKVTSRDSRQNNEEFSKAMLQALHGGLLGKL